MPTFKEQVQGMTSISVGTTPTDDELSQFLRDGVIDVTRRTLSMRPGDAERFMKESTESSSQGGLSTDGGQLLQGLINTSRRTENVVHLVRRDTVTQQSPFEIVNRALLKAALAWKVLDIKNGANVFRFLAAPLLDVGAVAKRGGIDDLRNEAFGDQKITEILGSRRAVRCLSKVLIRVDRRFVQQVL